ncbi:MAG: glutathione binding-like protein [Proteobacteria bacterium]|nr:glutathione binding-like protein [Pseudomonadota bacterium]
MTIELYLWATPNGRKISIMLEEVGLPYVEKSVNIGKGEQFEPDFLKISPNNRIPAIIDPEGPDGKPVSVFESGAILIYLAEKSGKLMPADPHKRVACLEWLMWQMGGMGPMPGQVHHFLGAAKEEVPYAIERYVNETHRLYKVLNERLADNDYVAGDEYSIADIAILPWVQRHGRHRTDLNDYPNVKRWFEALMARPAVEKGMACLGGINL